MHIDDKIFSALQRHIPEKAVQYCWELWKQDPFNFYITRSRNSKLGDFRFRKDRPIQTITINHDLNPYQFLITYIHEVAHYRAFTQFGLIIKPHGAEWKKTFQKLLEPLLLEKVFPREILIPLKRHMVNPKASSAADYFLMLEMRKFDTKPMDESSRFLRELKAGTQFEIKGRVFEKIETRRTRVLCLEVNSGRKYLISSHAEVKTV